MISNPPSCICSHRCRQMEAQMNKRLSHKGAEGIDTHLNTAEQTHTHMQTQVYELKAPSSRAGFLQSGLTESLTGLLLPCSTH